MSNSKKDFAVIFDVDGVLIDSREASKKSFEIVLRQYGIDFHDVKDPSGQEHFGGSSMGFVEMVKDQLGIDIEVSEFAQKITKEKTKIILESKIEAEIELLKLLDELIKNDVPIGIGTNGVKTGTFNKLSALGISDYFNVIVSAEDVGTSKPDPQIFLKVAQKLNVIPERCLVIEDSHNGLKAAHNANMKLIYFTKHTKTVNDNSGANMVVDDWASITLPVIERIIAD